MEFITVHHPLALAAAHYFRQRPIQNPPRSVIRIAAPGGITGDYAFFLFRLLISGITPTSTLVPVLVELNTGSVLPEAPAAFLLEVQSIRSAPPPEIAFDEGRFAALQEAAQIRMARVTRARQEEAQQRNDAVVEARLGALEQSIGFRIRRAEEQLKEARDARIQRMRQSQIENLRGQLQARKKELEEKRRLNVGAGLVACGLVRLDPSLQPVAVPLQGFTRAYEPRRSTSTPRPSIAPVPAPRVPSSQSPVRPPAPEEPKPSILKRILRWFR